MTPTHKAHTFANRFKPTRSPKFAKECAFATPSKKCFKKISQPSKNKNTQRTVQTRTDIALNVNRFGLGVCKLDTTHLRTDSRAAHNMGLNEMAGEVLIQTFVLSTNFCGRLTVRASKPPLR